MRRVTPFDARDYYYYYGASERGRRGAIFGGGFSAEAQALFAAMAVQPTAARKVVIDSFIRALKSGGVWDALDVLDVYAAHSEDAALVNWITPGTFDPELISTPTFEADVGFTGNGSDQGVNTNFNPSTAGGKYAQDSACFGMWSLTSGFLNVADIRVGGPPFAILSCRRFEGASGSGDCYINQNDDGGNAFDLSDGSGLFAVNRSASNAIQVYRNGTSIDTATNASSGLPNGEFPIPHTQTTRTTAIAFVGQSMTGPQHAAFYDAALAYMQAVGAV